MIQVIIFLILTALMAIAFAGELLLLVHRIIAKVRDKTNPKQVMRLKKTALFFAVAMILNLGFVAFTQFTASTPRIEAENSIAELTELELNSRKQWISLRGWDKTKPVLLF